LQQKMIPTVIRSTPTTPTTTQSTAPIGGIMPQPIGCQQQQQHQPMVGQMPIFANLQQQHQLEQDFGGYAQQQQLAIAPGMPMMMNQNPGGFQQGGVMMGQQPGGFQQGGGMMGQQAMAGGMVGQQYGYAQRPPVIC
jgi:hypothetical protein